MTVFYKVIEIWCKYPFQDTIEERYCIFSLSKKKFKDLGLKMESNTSIKEKEEFIKERLGFKKVTVKKIK